MAISKFSEVRDIKPILPRKEVFFAPLNDNFIVQGLNAQQKGEIDGRRFKISADQNNRMQIDQRMSTLEFHMKLLEYSLVNEAGEALLQTEDDVLTLFTFPETEIQPLVMAAMELSGYKKDEEEAEKKLKSALKTAGGASSSASH